MRPIIIKLPDDRTDYTFGHLVFWHFFDYGTRPGGDPANITGRRWGRAEAYRALKVSDRALRNWINDENLPKEIIRLCEVLFGENPLWDKARLELQEKFDEALRADQDKEAAAKTVDDAPATAQGENDTAIESEPVKAESEHISGADIPIQPGEIIGNARREPEPERSNGDPELHSDAPGPPLGDVAIPDPVRLYPGGERFKRVGLRARMAATLVAAVAILLGVFGWQRSHNDQTKAPETKVATNAPKPEPAAPPVSPGTSTLTLAPRPPVPIPTPPVVVAPPVIPSPPVASAKPAPEPSAAPQPSQPVTPPVSTIQQPVPAAPVPARPSEEEQQAADRQKKIDDELAARGQALRDAQTKLLEERARSLDALNGRDDDIQAGRERDANIATALGYRLRENTSVAGSSYRNLLTDSLADCARACTQDRCDAFGYYRDQYGPASRQPRYCYLFRKPFTAANYQGYVFGEPTVKRSLTDRTGAVEIPLRVAQDIVTIPPAANDGLVRCPSGPVKVTGFKIDCDQILGGGTTLGSTPLSHTVANINECAAKCRPVRSCVGFTFNAGDPDGRHACMLFGPTPQGRESAGWISGTR